MRTVGLIVEYNPLHNGHVYHFEQSRLAAGADAAIAVMSGHFLQRGEPAIMNKWARAECALRMGADLVIELPVRYAVSAAEWFAYGAVSLLDATGIVDAVCFGSELGDTGPLLAAARELSVESGEFRTLLRSELKKGLPYPAAYANAAAQGAAPPAEPNNTLGLHYLIALQRLGSAIEPLTVRRVAAGYHEPRAGDGHIASATAIRRAVFEAGGELSAATRYMPAYTAATLLREQRLGRAPLQWEAFAAPLLHMLSGVPAARLAELEEVDEGLEHRLAATIAAMKDEPFSVRRLLDGLKTKRYTYAKLQRMLTRILLQHGKASCAAEAMAGGPGYIRVLGFSAAKGRTLLKAMKTKAAWPVITNVRRTHAALLGDDIRATSVYALGYASPLVKDTLRDYYEPPVQLP